ncbi:hypothetical protein V8C26DRAFT_408043 [Trichoderma gracile]
MAGCFSSTCLKPEGRFMPIVFFLLPFCLSSYVRRMRSVCIRFIYQETYWFHCARWLAQRAYVLYQAIKVQGTNTCI